MRRHQVDLGDMLASVNLDDKTIDELTRSAETKAGALRQAKDTLSKRFGTKNRVNVADVMSWLDQDIEDYEEAATVGYWRGERRERPARPAPERQTRAPRATNAATSAPAAPGQPRQAGKPVQA
jgi:hypothetical protein